MAKDTRQFFLVPVRGERSGEPIPVPPGGWVIGRDPSSGLCLPDASVSRQHARLHVSPDGLSVEDCASRNGIRINGVPRRSAPLVAGDVMELGNFRFQIMHRPGPAAPANRPPGEKAVHPAPVPGDAGSRTLPRQAPAPSRREERHLQTLFHVCFWLTELSEEDELLDRGLPMLLQGFEGAEVHCYGEDDQLKASFQVDGKKPAVVFAPYLLKQFRGHPEATVVSGTAIKAYQKQAGPFHFLVGQVRVPGAPPGAACQVLVVSRRADWLDFDAQDRVLMQAICQIWARQSGKARELGAVKRENAALRAVSPAAHAGGMIGDGPSLTALRTRATKAAATKAPVLIAGETGSGKELLAHFIHLQSPRAAKPFVKTNCAAIPENLIETELFGHVKGAFTDAKTDRKGKFELADGGTLFLDEIGEMPLKLQSKILRALETGEIEKVGSEKTLKVDVRFIAASHRDLKAMAAAREFREDLYYRLSVLSLTVPALRGHPEDIPALASHFLQRFCEENGLAEMAFAATAITALQAHAWPGNVRELRNVVQRCAVEADGPAITADDVADALA